jgi:hypothetical protein
VQNRDGTFDYDPNGKFDGLKAGQTATDTFRYTVEDGNSGISTATVTITIGTAAITRELVGTQDRDLMLGTGGDDLIRSLGGHFDRMVGGGGADGFIFGAETKNGAAERDIIDDYQAGQDLLLLVNGAKVDEILERNDRVIVVFDGDGDRLHIYGDLEASDLVILDGNAATDYLL